MIYRLIKRLLFLVAVEFLEKYLSCPGVVNFGWADDYSRKGGNFLS